MYFTTLTRKKDIKKEREKERKRVRKEEKVRKKKRKKERKELKSQTLTLNAFCLLPFAFCLFRTSKIVSTFVLNA